MKEIYFTEKGQYLGRNGLAKAIGITINHNEFNNMIIIRPVNSKKEIGSSFITIPQSNIPELIDTLRLFLKGGSDTAPDPKSEKIAYIKKVIDEWGATSLINLENNYSLIKSSSDNGNVRELIEKLYNNGVEVVAYDGDIEIGDNQYSYEELSYEMIDEIVEIIEGYEADMLKTEERCHD